MQNVTVSFYICYYDADCTSCDGRRKCNHKKSTSKLETIVLIDVRNMMILKNALDDAHGARSHTEKEKKLMQYK